MAIIITKSQRSFINQVFPEYYKISIIDVVLKDEEITAQEAKDYIKEQLTTEQLTTIIQELVATGFSNMGQFMQHLNSNYKGQFDGKLASSIVNKILKG